MRNLSTFKYTATAIIGASLLVAQASHADIDGDLDDLMGGFDEPAVEVTPANPTTSSEAGPWQLSGEIGLTAAYAYQHGNTGNLPFDNHLAHLIADTRLQLDYRNTNNLRGQFTVKGQYDAAYALNDRSNYSAATLDNYEQEFELDQAWIQGSLTDNIDIKFGRQQWVLGKLDMLTVNDRVHSLDSRYPGLSDIDELRLPTLMSRLDYYQDNWQASLAVSHEIRAPKTASLGVDVFPSAAFPSQVLSNMPALVEPVYSWDKTPYMLALSSNIDSWDLAFYHGRTLDNRWHQVTSPTPARQYGYIKQTGVAASTTNGSWLWKLEAAVLQDLAFSNVSSTKQRTDIGLGFDYNGWKDWLWTMELVARNYEDFEANMAALPNWQVEHDLKLINALQYQFNHNRSSITAMANYYGDNLQGGGMHKLLLEHELDQQLSFELAIIDYVGGDSVLADALADSDKITLRIEHQF
jgi:hypothetical protein